VLDYQVQVGNPADAPMLVPAVERISQRTGRIPRAVTADRQYGEAAIDTELAALGVQRVAIPRKGQRAVPAKPTSIPVRSSGWSNGAPALRAASATSSTATGGTGP
jgi:hypothetical protein